MGNSIFKGYSSRCSCCNVPMNDERVKIHNHQIDDLCSSCRHIVDKAVEYHEADVVELDHDVWRVQLGNSMPFEDVEDNYQGE